MPDGRDITRGEFLAAMIAALAGAVLFADLVMAPYPSPDVCLAVAAVSMLACLFATVAFVLLRWKRGAL